MVSLCVFRAPLKGTPKSICQSIIEKFIIGAPPERLLITLVPVKAAF
jgi:hypothetical protein